MPSDPRGLEVENAWSTKKFIYLHEPFFTHHKSVNFYLSNCQGLGDFSHERHLQAIGGTESFSFIWEGLDVIPERKLCRASHDRDHQEISWPHIQPVDFDM